MSPDCWTTQLLTPAQLSEICDWLMRRQKAQVTAQSLMEDFEQAEPDVPENLLACYQYDHKELAVAQGHVQDMIRHIGALRELAFGGKGEA
jgi:hypothetical protein